VLILRPSWDEYFLGIAGAVSRRSSCPRAHVGAVFVDPVNKRILATGYNGAPAGEPDCYDEDCIMRDGHCVRAKHAEINAIEWARDNGVNLRGAICYCELSPCNICVYEMFREGIAGFHWRYPYKNVNNELCMPFWASLNSK
jgi:dCMP deaminase